jgi:hypothetical protein
MDEMMAEKRERKDWTKIETETVKQYLRGFVMGAIAVIVIQVLGKWIFKIGREYEIKRKGKKEKEKK